MLILASGSPRRRDMLTAAGLEFDVIPSPAEELHDESMPLHLLCEANAELKALAVAKEHPKATVVGADTLVYIDETPLGKPKTEQEAYDTLARLSGRTHQVCTGVCIAQGENVETFHAITEVVFKKLTPEIITDYMSKVNVMDKAGSYAVQEHGDMIIEEVRGNYDNVVGLPVEELCKLLPIG
ncbi:MAG: nucleoside triphosphate pyrophosphatase [Akkermansiaceae bacterium]